MADKVTYMLVLGVFDGVDKAQEHQDFLKLAQSRAFDASKSVGQIQCDAQGKISIKETGDAGFTKGAVAGGTAAAAASLSLPAGRARRPVRPARWLVVWAPSLRMAVSRISSSRHSASRSRPARQVWCSWWSRVWCKRPRLSSTRWAARQSTSYSLDGIELVGAQPEAENAAAEAMLNQGSARCVCDEGGQYGSSARPISGRAELVGRLVEI